MSHTSTSGALGRRLAALLAYAVGAAIVAARVVPAFLAVEPVARVLQASGHLLAAPTVMRL